MRFKIQLARVIALAGTSTLCLSGTSLAQQVTTAAGVPEQVVITGRLEEDLPARLAELGTRVNTVTAGEIQNGGYADVAQSLQTLVPGLYVAPKSGPFDYVDVSFQGSRTEDVLWTVDGVRINNRLYGGTTPLDTLPASMIERIEVLEGPQALFYGTQGIAGAINIVTKDFLDHADGRVGVGFDTNNGRHADGYFRDKIGDSSFVVYGSADKSEGFQPFRDQDYQPSQTDRRRGYDVLTIGGKYAYDFNNDLRVTLSEQHTDAKLDFTSTQLQRQAFNERNEDILSAKVDYTASDRLQFFLKGYYHWWYAHYTEFDNDLNSTGALTGSVSVIDDHDFWGFTDYGVNALAKFTPTPEIDTYLGYDYQNYAGNDVVLVIDKQTEHVHAVFGEIATTPAFISNVRLAAGFRYNAPSVGPSATVWNVTGRWDVTPEFFVKGMVGTAFRLPTDEELFANDPDDERGNPNTKPEQSTNINASVGGNFGMRSIRWEVIGFARDIKNLIGIADFDSTTNQDVFGNTPGTVRVRGVELVVDAAFAPDLSGSFSYTHSEAKDLTHLQIRRVPEQLAKATVDYHPMNMPFGVFASVNYVGDTFDTLGGIRQKYGDDVVVDVGGRVFLDMNRHHRIDVNLQNVFDEDYSTHLTRGFPDDGGPSYLVGYRGLPRTLSVHYTYNFF
ncbi:MAG TPA: TonB-dependent receptor [Micropepsaceae bacterium]|nr:TonB-dependent receptor [Micropepsaceae bacterium]